MKIKLLFTALLVSSIAFSQTLDASFGIGGKVVSGNINVRNILTSILVLPNQKIITCGGTRINSSLLAFTLMQYNQDGVLDSAFGLSGVVITPVGSPNIGAVEIALQTDGKIVVVGAVGTLTNENFAILRYHADGTLDTDFGDEGMVVTDFGSGSEDVPYSVAVQSDGKILVAGKAEDNLAIARYNVDGSFDDNFGTGGKIQMNLGFTFGTMESAEIAHDIKILPDGKIVFCGYTNKAINDNFYLGKLENDGALDTSFGENGFVFTSFDVSERATRLSIVEGDKVLLGGYQFAPNGFKIALAEYNSDGSLYEGFGVNGKALIDVSDYPTMFYFNDMAIQADGKIVLCGTEINAQGFSNTFLTMRLENDGAVETGFGNNGMLVTDFDGEFSGSNAVAIQDDGKIVIGGSAMTISDYDFAVARYTNVLSTELIAENQFSVYPNPFTNWININFNLREAGNVTIDMFDMEGRKIQNLLPYDQFLSGENALSLNLPENLAKGVYFLNISTGTKRSTIKIIK